MAILKANEVRKLSRADRDKRMHELQLLLIKYRSKVLAGGELENPGLIREIRRTIARIKTINHEEDSKEKSS